MSSDANVRQAILRAASSRFARQGFKKTSMDEIAKTAHVGKGTIYALFQSKEELFATIIHDESDALLAKISEAVSGEADPDAKVRAFVVTRMASLRDAANFHQITDEALLELLPLANEARLAYFDKELGLLSDVLDEGQRRGKFDLHDSRSVALAILSALTGLETAMLRVSSPVRLERGIQVATDIFLRGLRS